MLKLSMIRSAFLGLFLSSVVHGYVGYDDVMPSGFSGDYPYNGSLDPDNPPVFPDAFNEELTTYNSSLMVLFGSWNLTESLVYAPAKNFDTNFWVLDQVHHDISSRLVAQSHKISEHDKMQLKKALHVIDEEIERIVNRTSDISTYKKLNDARGSLDCALGRSSTNWYFNHLIDKSSYSYSCIDEIPDLWRDVVGSEHSESCPLKDGVQSVILVNKAFRLDSDSRTKEDVFNITVDLMYVLSVNYDFLKHILCPRTYMEGKCPHIDNMLCNDLTDKRVLGFATALQNGSKLHPPQSGEDMMKLLDVQSYLAEASNTLVKREKFSGSLVNFGKDMLNNYIGIVDTAIGKSSVGVWQKTAQSSSEDVFKDVLVNSEKFVGQFSKIILKDSDQQSKEEIDQAVMSVKMGKYNKDSNDTVEFSFTGAQVWTQPFKDDDSGNVYVYALHYNSWWETLQEISGNRSNASSPDLKLFVGKGGVISLSTATDQAKKSVPVTYKMNFNDDVNVESGATTRRCLSCEYLDTETNQWRSTGCHVTGADHQGVTCHCNHTTNFAAFMMPYDPEYNTTEGQAAWLNIAEYVGSSLSVVGLLISFIAFCLVRESVRNDRLKAHMNLVIALLFVHLIQLGADFAVQSNELCVTVTIATHYFLLSAFMWMLVEGIFLYLYVVQVFVHSKLESRRWMYAVGWLTPAIIVAISAGYGLTNDVYIQPAPEVQYCDDGQYLYPPIDPNEIQKYSSCWLDAESGMTWSFIGPAIAVIAFNLVILCKVIQVLVKLSGRSKGMQAFNAKQQFVGQGQGYNNTAYRPKVKSAAKVSEYRTTSSEQFSASITEGDDSALHGSAFTPSRPQSRSPSQVYLQNRVMERPRMTSSANANDRNFLADARTAVKGAIVLLPLLGIPWICGMFGYKSFALTVVFVVLNSVQGFAIFLVYCVFNHEVRRGLQRHLQLYRINRDHTGRGRTASTSSLKAAFNRGLLRSWRRRSTAVSTLSSNHV